MNICQKYAGYLQTLSLVTSDHPPLPKMSFSNGTRFCKLFAKISHYYSIINAYEYIQRYNKCYVTRYRRHGTLRKYTRKMNMCRKCTMILLMSSLVYHDQSSKEINIICKWYPISAHLLIAIISHYMSLSMHSYGTYNYITTVI